MPLIKEFELANENFTDTIGDSNGNTLTVSTFETLPSVNIGPSLRDYLLTIPEIVSIFGSEVNYYNRQDYSQRALPAINIYPMSEEYVGSFGWLNGKLKIKIIFDLANNREIITDQCQRLANYVALILNGTNAIDFMYPYVPGLVELGYSASFDYSDSNSLDNGKKVDAYEVSGVAEYKVSMLEYYEYLWSNTSLDLVNVKVNLEK